MASSPPQQVSVPPRDSQPVATTATYRWQFEAGFTFDQAAQLAEYLQELGVSDCYASPVFQARTGSRHGYDVCDFNSFNAEIGGRAGFDPFSAALGKHGLGLILDMVPNHMGIGDPLNRWWEDVLEHGPASVYAAFFDISWMAPTLEGKVLLPVLGDHFGTVLEAGQLKLIWEHDRLWIGYYDRRFPVSALGYHRVLRPVLADPRCSATPQFQKQVADLERPGQSGVESTVALEMKEAVAQLMRSSSDTRSALDSTLAQLNGVAGKPESFAALENVLNTQHYRLAFWRLASSRLNYRRFFDITDLAGLRVERPEVFEQSHRLVLDLAGRGVINGLRIDHPDGLWDPAGYFERLQASYRQRSAELRPSVALGTEGTPLYVLAEKILAADEPLPADWALHGTTGYDFLNSLNGVFVDPSSEASLDHLYRELADGQDDFDQVVLTSKLLVMNTSLTAEVDALVDRLQQLVIKDRHCRDFAPAQLREALTEWVASMEVYRTYLRPERPDPSEEDARRLEEARVAAAARRPELGSVFDFLTNLCLEAPSADQPEPEGRWLFLMKLQQLTGPAMAKGVEDTAFYRYNRFLSLNEVGGHPDHFGCSLEEFHSQNVARVEKWPHSMLTTATHDTKRSEDMRARLNVLSEMPTAWAEAVQRWRKLNKKISVAGNLVPEPNTEYFLYQTLAGVWPMAWPEEGELSALRERVWNALLKSVREAKLHTSWLDNNVEYEGALERFVTNIMLDVDGFLADFRPLHETIAYFGRWNSLSQVLLKATSPGVPDFYQGCELWDLSLVDPDNRRPVDYALRRKWAAELAAASDLPALARELVEDASSGRIKLFLTMRILNFRRQHPDLFTRGRYLPVTVAGPRADHVIAFLRQREQQTVLVVAPRWTAKLTGDQAVPPVGTDVWKDTKLELPKGAPARFRDVFTGEALSATGGSLPVGNVLAQFPVALLA